MITNNRDSAEVRNKLALMTRGERVTWSSGKEYFDILFDKNGVFNISVTRINDHRSGRFQHTKSLKEAVDTVTRI